MAAVIALPIAPRSPPRVDPAPAARRCRSIPGGRRAARAVRPHQPPGRPAAPGRLPAPPPRRLLVAASPSWSSATSPSPGSARCCPPTAPVLPPPGPRPIGGIGGPGGRSRPAVGRRLRRAARRHPLVHRPPPASLGRHPAPRRCSSPTGPARVRSWPAQRSRSMASSIDPVGTVAPPRRPRGRAGRRRQAPGSVSRTTGRCRSAAPSGSVADVRCPSCAEIDDKVVDSRANDDGSAIRRRRECLACGHRFTTFERSKRCRCWCVKRSGDRVPFDRAKVEAGVRAAAKGRPVDDGQVGRARRRGRGRRCGCSGPRSPASRSAWPCSTGCARSTRSPTCASPASTRTSTTRPTSSASSRLLTKATEPKRH